MKKKYEYSKKQYFDYWFELDGLTALEILCIPWNEIAEPLENVHQRILDNYRDGNLSVEIEIKLTAAQSRREDVMEIIFLIMALVLVFTFAVLVFTE